MVWRTAVGGRSETNHQIRSAYRAVILSHAETPPLPPPHKSCLIMKWRPAIQSSNIARSSTTHPLIIYYKSRHCIFNINFILFILLVHSHQVCSLVNGETLSVISSGLRSADMGCEFTNCCQRLHQDRTQCLVCIGLWTTPVNWPGVRTVALLDDEYTRVSLIGAQKLISSTKALPWYGNLTTIGFEVYLCIICKIFAC